MSIHAFYDQLWSCSGSHTLCTLAFVHSDRFVILGNHRDAWVFGGVDPNSGTAALMELARALSELRSKGELFCCPELHC